MKDTAKNLEKVGTLIEGWIARGNIDELERDLALRILQEAYSVIKFGSVPRVILESVVTAAPAPASAPVAAPAPVEVEQPAPAPAPVEAETPAPEPAPEPVKEPAPAQHKRPHRIAPEVIRSLYGNEPEPSIEPSTDGGNIRTTDGASSPTEARMSPHSCGAGKAETPAEKPTETPAEKPAETPTEKPSKTTLGDTLNHGHQTLGETLRNGSEKDVASAIASAGCSDLRSVIGINDRFLMIRDMFDGDSAAFDAAIDILDGFDDLDSAIIYIHDTYEWSADSPGVRRLVDLLERRLG